MAIHRPSAFSTTLGALVLAAAGTLSMSTPAQAQNYAAEAAQSCTTIASVKDMALTPTCENGILLRDYVSDGSRYVECFSPTDSSYVIAKGNDKPDIIIPPATPTHFEFYRDASANNGTIVTAHLANVTMSNDVNGSPGFAVQPLPYEQCTPDNGLFANGFENGNTNAWSVTFPPPGSNNVANNVAQLRIFCYDNIAQTQVPPTYDALLAGGGREVGCTSELAVQLWNRPGDANPVFFEGFTTTPYPGAGLFAVNIQDGPDSSIVMNNFDARYVNTQGGSEFPIHYGP